MARTFKSLRRRRYKAFLARKDDSHKWFVHKLKSDTMDKTTESYEIVVQMKEGHLKCSCGGNEISNSKKHRNCYHIREVKSGRGKTSLDLMMDKLKQSP